MIKIIYEQKENRAAAYDDEKFIGESTYAILRQLTYRCLYLF